MKKYIKPEIHITQLTTEDILTRSYGYNKNKRNQRSWYQYNNFNNTYPYNTSPKNSKFNAEGQYNRIPLLTNNEFLFYKELKRIADKYNLTLFTKIRMADLVEPSAYREYEYKIAFSKIKAKHVDFALCDTNTLKVLLLIELDDNSHRTQERIERDLFVESVYKSTGYKLLRVYNVAGLEQTICNLIGYNNKKEPPRPQTNKNEQEDSEKLSEEEKQEKIKSSMKRMEDILFNKKQKQDNSENDNTNMNL